MREDLCSTCGEPLSWFEIEANWMQISDWGYADCDDCCVAAAMRHAISRGEDELVAAAEVEKQQREDRSRAIERERRL